MLLIAVVVLLLLFMISVMLEIRKMFPAAWQCTIIDSNVISGTHFVQEKEQSLEEGLWIKKLNHRIVAPTIVSVSNFTINDYIEHSFELFAFERGYKVAFGVEVDNDYLYVSVHPVRGPYDDELQESGYWPMNGAFIIELLNQHSDIDHYKIVYLLKDNLCSECSNRLTGDTIYSFLLPFVSLNQLIGNAQYHANGNLFLRISYSSCYPCVHLTEVIQALIIALALDLASIFVLLMFTVFCRTLIRNSHLFIRLNLLYVVIFDVAIDTIASFVVMLLLFYLNDTIHFTMESHVIFYHTVPVILCATERATYFLASSSVVDSYPHGMKGLVIVRPFWLLFAIELFYSNPVINPIVVLCITFITIFVVNVYGLLSFK